MFSETRYARNGDLRVAYRTSREGPRDIVFVPNWFTNCEVLPEHPAIQDVTPGLTDRVQQALARARSITASTVGDTEGEVMA